MSGNEIQGDQVNAEKGGSEVIRVLAERPIEEDPDILGLLRHAEETFASGRFVETEDLCRHLLERAPENASGWALLGALARRSGDFDYAAELMEQAVSLKPQTANFWSTLGEIRRDQKDLDAALAAFQNAIELHPNFPNAWLGLAVVHDERKEASLAETAYYQALHYSKDRVETAQIRVNFAGFLREQNRIKEGIIQMRKAVSDVPESRETMVLLESFISEGDNLDDAMDTVARGANFHGIRISVIHPTCRPDKALAIRKLWLSRATHPQSIEYIFGINENDDPGQISHYPHALSQAVPADHSTAVANYNAAASAATAPIIIAAQDDIYPPDAWDEQIWQALCPHTQLPRVLHVHDGFREDKLMVIMCINRAWIKKHGTLLCPEYDGYYSDTEFSLHAYEAGEVLNGHHIKFYHDHPAFTHEAADADYFRQANPTAVARAREIFHRRNPAALAQGWW